MKYLLASLVTAGLMVDVAIAQEDSITSVNSQSSGKDWGEPGDWKGFGCGRAHIDSRNGCESPNEEQPREP